MAILSARLALRQLARSMMRVGALAGALLAFTLGCAQAAAAQDKSLEYAVKATYLYKFAPFVEWPPRAFPAPGAPFAICVFGQDPFGEQLDQSVRPQSFAGRRMVVRRLQAAQETAGCNVLYVGRSRAQPPAEVLRLVRSQPVLTVTDESQGVSGGIVHFELRDGRVRFALDAGAAEQSGLVLSSKLLALATSVRRAG